MGDLELIPYTTLVYNRLYHNFPYPCKCITLHGTRLHVVIHNHDLILVCDTNRRVVNQPNKLLQQLSCTPELSGRQYIFEVLLSNKKLTIIDILMSDGVVLSKSHNWFERLVHLEKLNPTEPPGLRLLAYTPTDPLQVYKTQTPALLRSLCEPGPEYYIPNHSQTLILAIVGHATHKKRKLVNKFDSVVLLAGMINSKLTIFGYSTIPLGSCFAIGQPRVNLVWAPHAQHDFDNIQYYSSFKYVTCRDVKFRGTIVSIPKHKINYLDSSSESSLSPPSGSSDDSIGIAGGGPKSLTSVIGSVTCTYALKSPFEFHLSELESILHVAADAASSGAILNQITDLFAQIRQIAQKITNVHLEHSNYLEQTAKERARTAEAAVHFDQWDSPPSSPTASFVRNEAGMLTNPLVVE